MNVILFSARFGTRHFDLGRRWTMALTLLGGFLVLSGIFFAGVQHGSQSAVRAADSQPNEGNASVLNTQRKLDALVTRVAQLNAQIIRLDALGRQLTEMAHLDKGEFNFNPSAAPVGGPEPTAEDTETSPGEVDTALDDLTSELLDREHQLGILESMIVTRDMSRRLMPRGRPVAQGWISSHFGHRVDPFTGRIAFHRGIDFAGPSGSQVLAVAPGVVTWAKDRSGYGQVVDITHAGGYVTRYAHNQRLLVKSGDMIRKGQPIALIGSTGRSTGPHLHFEVLKDGRNLDPMRFVLDAG